VEIGAKQAPAERGETPDALAGEVPESISFQAQLSPQTAARIWRHVVENLGELVADQARLCERVACPAPGRLVVSFPANYTSCRQFCEMPEQRAKLEAALAVAAGEPVRLEFEVLPDAAPQGPPRPSGMASLRQQQAEIAARPIVRRAMELFEVEHPRIDPPRNKS
jgi:hypothetical protein